MIYLVLDLRALRDLIWVLFMKQNTKRISFTSRKLKVYKEISFIYLTQPFLVSLYPSKQMKMIMVR